MPTYDESTATYKEKVVEYLLGMKTRQVATISIANQDTTIILEEFNWAMFAGSKVPTSLTLKFGNKKIRVGIQLGGFHTPNAPKNIRFYLFSKNNRICNNFSDLLSPSVDGGVKLIWQDQRNTLNWGTNGVDLNDYITYWYDNITPKIKFTPGIFDNLKLTRQNQNFSITIDPNDTLPAYIYDNNDDHHGGHDDAIDNDVNNEQLAKIATYHAKSIIMRAVDWILFATRDNTKFNIAINDGEYQLLESAENLFDEPIKYKPEVNQETPYLRFDQLKKECNVKNLYFPDNVYQVVCTTMNLGRHLILTGPPGCGKSRLAEIVGTLIGTASGLEGESAHPKIVTASPGWTSGEVIGRYFPSPIDGKLQFHPGVFLQAIEKNRCLVIDEINRANLDECFGELFTVLAGQACDLPYRDRLENISESEAPDDEEVLSQTSSVMSKKDIEANYGNIKIVPRTSKTNNYPDCKVFEMSERFRLIGTMNDSDRSALHNLSFALLRRFDVVRIDPPNANELDALYTNILKVIGQNNIDYYVIPMRTKAVKNGISLIITSIKEVISNLFFNATNDNLITRRIVGVSAMIECTCFITENLRRRKDRNNIQLIDDGDGKTQIGILIRSLTALALTTKIIPQLESLDENEFRWVIDFIKIQLGNDNYSAVSHNGISAVMQPITPPITVANFFLREVKSTYRRTMKESLIDAIMNAPAHW